MSEIDGLARAGGAADNTGLSISLESGGIPAANVPLWRSACPNPKGPGTAWSQIALPSGSVRYVLLMFHTMGSKSPHRYEIMDREFPVRLSVRADPATNELTRQWLQRHVGTGNYASKPHTLWSTNKAHCIYFRSLHAATSFILGCPHIQLIGEPYRGPYR